MSAIRVWVTIFPHAGIAGYKVVDISGYQPRFPILIHENQAHDNGFPLITSQGYIDFFCKNALQKHTQIGTLICDPALTGVKTTIPT